MKRVLLKLSGEAWQEEKEKKGSMRLPALESQSR